MSAECRNTRKYRDFGASVNTVTFISSTDGWKLCLIFSSDSLRYGDVYSLPFFLTFFMIVKYVALDQAAIGKGAEYIATSILC